MKNQYDIIILGAGAAGLSLAVHLAQAKLNQRVLIVERQQTRTNDRTWCFWESKPGPFEAVVSQCWNHIWIHGENLNQRYNIAPFRYKMIRGSDFYAHCTEIIQRAPNMTQLTGNVESLEETAYGARVTINGQIFMGNSVFNSLQHLQKPQEKTVEYTQLYQHFKGWMIETNDPVFDVSTATVMDFRVPQNSASYPGGTHFAYVLPISERRALVEYTIFSSTLLPQTEYDTGLRHYIQDVLKLTDYTVTETEFGVIPMTDAPFQLRPSRHVMNIGTHGGRTKPSTGYTFQRIQSQSAQIVLSLRSSGQPFYATPKFDRYVWMDSVMLNVLANENESGKVFFSRLYRTNPICRILEFLNEHSSLQDDLALMLTCNIPVFAEVGLNVAIKSIKRHVVNTRASIF